MYNLQTVMLSGGGHDANSREKCAMEAVAFLAGERHTDKPMCVCPVIAEFVRVTNDWFTQQDRDKRLLPMLFDFIGTRSSDPRIELERSYIAFTYAVKVFTRIYLHTLCLLDEAKAIEGLPDIVDRATADIAVRRLSTLSMVPPFLPYILPPRMQLVDKWDPSTIAGWAARRAAKCAESVQCVHRKLVSQSINCIHAMLAVGSRTPVERVRTIDDLAQAMAHTLAGTACTQISGKD